jgi:hypothetical protein
VAKHLLLSLYGRINRVQDHRHQLRCRDRSVYNREEVLAEVTVIFIEESANLTLVPEQLPLGDQADDALDPGGS